MGVNLQLDTLDEGLKPDLHLDDRGPQFDKVLTCYYNQTKRNLTHIAANPPVEKIFHAPNRPLRAL